MPDVFISYARGDSRDFVARLSAALEERGKDTWVDLEDIPPASSWNEDLRAGIAAQRLLLLRHQPRIGRIASTAAPSSTTRSALGKRHPACAAPARSPTPRSPRQSPPATGSPRLGRFTDDFDTSLATLVSAIETDLDWVREHTRWGLRAEEWERRGEDRSLLARGSDLDQAEAFISGGGNREPAPTELQGRYVVASRARRHASPASARHRRLDRTRGGHRARCPCAAPAQHRRRLRSYQAETNERRPRHGHWPPTRSSTCPPTPSSACCSGSRRPRRARPSKPRVRCAAAFSTTGSGRLSSTPTRSTTHRSARTAPES